ncbi:MAG TPA: succinate dehydrogenase iron-sulfur subunit [Fibrobacteria bacterium]|nr:succinate dehydrogenase iron-sulfur subunit [Fibrobacteria bacterium]HOX52071.1 succinate dehydrogenase iron-sulfur subunit [Fibrobacteria bacterium]
MSKNVEILVKRQDSPKAPSYWVEFSVPYEEGMNVISLLQAIRRDPKDKSGKSVTPVTWESSCLEEVCGACTMVINGKVRQACTALVDQLELPIKLEPMSKFPVERDLRVNRQRIFDNLKKVNAWVEVDGYHDLGPGPRQNPEDQATTYKYSECMSCGCCMEVCPQFTKDNDFIGAAVLGQARLFNMHPTGEMQMPKRLDKVTDKGGIQDCGLAQQCVKACPKHIPLVEAIGQLQRDITVNKVLGSLKK